jgi:hypothetical protein
LDRVFFKTHKYKPPCRRNAEGHGCKTYQISTEDSGTATSSGRKSYYLPFLVLPATVRELFDRPLHFTWRSTHISPRIKDIFPTLRQAVIKAKGGFRQKLHRAIKHMFILFFEVTVRVLKYRNKSTAVLSPLDWRNRFCTGGSDADLCVCHFGIVDN